VHGESWPEILPGEQRTGAALNTYLTRMSNTLYHYTGTCAMGQNRDAVCDPQFRVRGTEGLFVCDASAIPSIPAFNTQATVMALAIQFSNLWR
jgi:choline dehydrogenase